MEHDQMTIFKEEEKKAKWCFGSVHGKRKTLGNTTLLLLNPFQFNVLTPLLLHWFTKTRKK